MNIMEDILLDHDIKQTVTIEIIPLIFSPYILAKRFTNISI